MLVRELQVVLQVCVVEELQLRSGTAVVTVSRVAVALLGECEADHLGRGIAQKFENTRRSPEAGYDLSHATYNTLLASFAVAHGV